MTKRDINKRFKVFIDSGAKSISDAGLEHQNIKKRFFTIKEAAEYLNMSPKTINNKRSLGTFPVKSKRNGGKVLFEVSDIVRYANSL